MNVRTSDTDPIRVDFLDGNVLKVPGRLGLTFAPGKKAASTIYGSYWERDLHADLKRLRDVYRVQLLVSLMEDAELEQAGIPDLHSEAGYLGLEVVHFPMRSLFVPELHQEQGFAGLVEYLLERLDLGATIVVHGLGGLGRSGLVCAAVLVKHGLKADEAMAATRVARRGAIETPRQEAYLRLFAAGAFVASSPPP